MGLSPEAVFNLRVMFGALIFILDFVSLYFVYRWGVTLLATDDEVREVLMGPILSSVFSGTNQTIVAVASFYLGLKLVYTLVSTAQWEITMQRERSILMSNRKHKI